MCRRLILAALGASTFALAGCPMPPSSAARMQEAATDLNTNTRFGRMELAIERVAPSEREDFVAHRRAWGKSVSLADYEMVGAHMGKDENDAEVSVRYSWYRPEEGDLRTTVVRQRWHDHKGDWMLVGEARVEGDFGLFGEPVPSAPSASPRTNLQFPTVRLGSD